MKKILSLIFAIAIALNINAQTHLTQAVDFTAIDCYGEEEINLFEILDGGQYVFIDFFFPNCTPCQTVAPKVAEAYQRLGSNQHDVFFMEISPVDYNYACQWWAENYGIEYPTISADYGAEIDDIYGIPTYPTFVLIAPDREILLQDIDVYPIPDAQTIIDILAEFGIEEPGGNEEVTSPTVEIALGEVTDTSVEATFTPNEECAKYHFVMSTAPEMEQWAGMMGLTMEELVVAWGIEKNDTFTYTWTEQIPNTEYTIYVLPKDADGNMGELNTMKVTTSQSGGTGVSVIDLEVIVVNDSTVRTIATPNEETASYRYGLMEKAYFDSIGEAAAVQYFREDPYIFYDVDDWTWSPLTVNTEFVAIATGQNAVGEWGETTIVHFKTPGGVGCAEFMVNNLNVYPNPATSLINITSDKEGESEIKILDVTGRCVKNILVNDLRNATISIEDLNKGVYFINVNGKVEKLVVE